MTKDIIIKLKALSNPKALEGMARFGINPENNFGVSIPNLRKIAKETGRDHQLAHSLWATEIHDARILASMIEEPEEVSKNQADKWASDFDSWDVCDEVCMNVFEKLPFAYEKAVEWAGSTEEFIKRAGFVLMARLAVSDKKAEDIKFIKFFPYIKEHSKDNRNFVKKAVNWALRQIGKRNINLNKLAMQVCEEIYNFDFKSSKWIATDALRELNNDKIQKRLRERGKKNRVQASELIG